MKNQVRNEIFRQMSLTLTLTLDVPVRPMDTKGLKWAYLHSAVKPFSTKMFIIITTHRLPNLFNYSFFFGGGGGQKTDFFFFFS